MNPLNQRSSYGIGKHLPSLSIIIFRIGAELNNQQCRECGTLMDPEYRRDTKKVVKMLSIVVAVFAVLDLPIHIVWIWFDFFDGANGSLYFILILSNLLGFFLVFTSQSVPKSVAMTVYSSLYTPTSQSNVRVCANLTSLKISARGLSL